MYIVDKRRNDASELSTGLEEYICNGTLYLESEPRGFRSFSTKSSDIVDVTTNRPVVGSEKSTTMEEE